MFRNIIVFVYLLNFINCYGQVQSSSFIDSLDKSYRFFFTGECHSKKDYNHSLTLFKKLYHSHHVRKIILEFPQELEFGFNKYINDSSPKDSDYIDLIALGKINTENEFHDFLEKLRLFNRSKSSIDDKISIICPDICNSIKYALLSIILSTEKHCIITNRELDDLFYKILKLKMKHFDNNQDKKTVVLVYELKYYLDSYPTDFKVLYKSDFTAVKRKINCLYKSTLAYQIKKFLIL